MMATLVPLDATPARERADRIRTGLTALAPDILAAWTAKDWLALGYASWTEYVVGEFGGPLRLGRTERKQVVADMREIGMSTRAIGTALGVNHSTIVRDEDAGAFAPPPPDSSPDLTVEVDTNELVAAVDLLDGLRSSLPVSAGAQAQVRSRTAFARRLRHVGTYLGAIALVIEQEATE